MIPYCLCMLSLSLLSFLLSPYAHDLFSWAFAGSCVCFSTLTPYRKPAAMSKASVAPNIHQSFDAHRDISTQVTFHFVIPLYHLSEPDDFVLSEVLHPSIRINRCHFQNLPSRRTADPIDISEPYLNPFLTGQINSCNSCQCIPPFR